MSKKDLNFFQLFALSYWLCMERRTHYEDMRLELETQTFNLFPERWKEIYLSNIVIPETAGSGEGSSSGLDIEIPVGIDELDEYYSNLGEKRTLTGADIPGDFSDVWGEWS